MAGKALAIGLHRWIALDCGVTPEAAKFGYEWRK
jgi:hypothetical protein